MFHKAIINEIAIFIKIKWMFKVIPFFRGVYSDKPASIYIMLCMIICTIVQTITFTVIFG
ncbi:hypothetical protein DI388_17900 [Escherichia coli]|nr:hypothetical protein A3467_12540 [Enterobacter roggenkampii]TOY96508.1 hypothetical protein DI388_17900 [Escherichia coli]